MINVAVVGCGYWGPNLVRNINAVGNAKLSVVCDLQEQRLTAIKKLYPHLATTNSFSSVLQDPSIHAVILATPMSTHYKLGKMVLEAGKHLFVEKPLAGSSAEAQELILLASQRQKILMVGHTFEYSAPVNKIKDIITSGELGDIYYLDSYRVNLGLFQPDLSVIWDLAPHDVSIILYMVNSKPVSVNAQGQSYVNGHVEDVANITIKFENNVMAHVIVSWIAPCKLRRTTIVGTKKMIVYDDLEPEEKVKVYDRGVTFTHEEVAQSQVIYRTGDINSPNIPNTEPLKVEMEHFVDCIINNKLPRSNGTVGLNVVRILEAAQESIRKKGQEVLL